jgi:FtsH-binding integral membrane protein
MFGIIILRRSKMSKLYQYLAISLSATVVGFFVGLFFIPESVIAVANILLLVFLVIMLIGAWIIKLVKKRASGQIRFPIWLVYIFAFVEGALLYPALMYYLASLGIVLFAEIIIGTMVIFVALAYIGQKKESGSYIGLGRILFVILTVMVVLSIINIFLRVDMLSMVLSDVGIVVFSAYILVDVNQFKTAYEAGMINDSSDYSIYVLNVYLDIINLLLDILDLVRRIKD